jgi:hypothetical protein
MLDNHPEVAIPLDTVKLWPHYYSKLGQYNDLKTLNDIEQMITDLIQEERIQLWEAPLRLEDVLACRQGDDFPHIIDAFYRAYALSRGKKYWGDKNPGNMRRIHLLNRWFPNCKIIHIIRDGRDACLSLSKQEFGSDDLLQCANSWREQVWWVRCVGEILGPSRYLELRYEDLVDNPERELKKICGYLDITYSDQMLLYYNHVEKSVPEAKRHLWPLITEPPRKDNIGRWRRELSKGLRVCFERRAGSVLQELGYEVLPGTCAGGYWEEVKSFTRTAWRAFRRRAKDFLTGRTRSKIRSSLNGLPRFDLKARRLLDDRKI